jgi:regulator of PEP synthase PpsR (kinase-PPPase family)
VVFIIDEKKFSETSSIFILSDSVGETGELLIRAATVQFENTKFDIRRKTHINSIAEVEEALQEARESNAMVAHTVVNQELLTYIEKRINELNLIGADLINPVLSAMESLTGQHPLYKAGLNRKVDKTYFSKVDAIEFAVKFDDGKDPKGLLKADVVLIGVSRTSKTPLCMYLAYQGIKAANVPLVVQSPLPDELFKLPPGKVVGLRVRPEKLQEIRKQRLKIMGLPPSTDYTSMEKMLEEFEFASAVMKRIGCPIIDITERAIEETAVNVIQLCRMRKE